MANIELSTLGAVIKAAYENEADTNGFTDAEKAKLASLENFSGSYNDLADKPALNFVPTAQKGQANGVAPLDAAGFVPMQHLNVSGLSFKGAWNPNTNTPTLVDGTGSVGDFYKASASGTFNFGNGSYTFNEGDWAIFAAGVWQRIGSSETVGSVNGKIGDVVLNASDVGALPSTYAAPVASVNSKTGAVVLSAADVGAKPSSYTPAWSEVSGKPAFDALYQAKMRGTIGPSIPALLVRRTSVLSLTSGTFTTVPMNGLGYDFFGILNQTTGLITIPSWAKYARFTGQVTFAASNAVGRRAAGIVKGATSTAYIFGGFSTQTSLANQNTTLNFPIITGVIPVAAGEVYRLQAVQFSGAALNLVGDSTDAQLQTWLQVELFEAIT